MAKHLQLSDFTVDLVIQKLFQLFKSYWKCETVGYHGYDKNEQRHLPSLTKRFLPVTFLNTVHNYTNYQLYKK